MCDSWADVEVDKAMLIPFFAKRRQAAKSRIAEAHKGICFNHEAHYGLQWQALYETKKSI